MKRLLPFILFLIILIGGMIAVPVLLNPERHRAEITDTFTKILKRSVVIGPLSMSYFPPVLQAGQVAVMKEGGDPFLQIDAVSAPLDWRALFRLKFVPAGLELNHWKLTLIRKSDGSWDLGDWLSGLSVMTGAAGVGLRQVRWKDGEIHAVDPSAGPSQELVLGSVEGSWDPKQGTFTTGGAFTGLGAPARLTLTAAGQFFTSPQWSGDLQLSGGGDACAVHVENKAGAWDIKGKSAQWPLANAFAFLKFFSRTTVKNGSAAGSLKLSNWQFRLTSGGAKASFEHAAGISGGFSEAKGTLETTAAGIDAHVEGAAKEIPAGAVWGLLGEDLPLEGKITGLVTGLHVAVSTGTMRLESGEGVAQLIEGRYQVPAVSMKKLSRAKTLPYIRKKFPDFEIKGLPVTRASFRWRAKENLVTVDDGSFAVGALKGSWSGKLDAARQGVDAFVRLDIREKDSALLALVPPRYQTQPLFGRWLGTWQEWSLRSVASGKIPAAVQSRLRKAANQK